MEAISKKQQPLTYKQLKQEFKLTFDSFEPWYCIMGAWFAVADELHHRGKDIPDKWEYSPGAAYGDIRETENYWYPIMAASNTEDIRKFGNLLCRYASLFKKSYPNEVY